MIVRIVSLTILFGCLAAAQEPATKLIKLASSSIDKILEDEGETVRISGFVESTRTNATGIHFLEFKGTEFVCVTFSNHLSKFTEGAPSEVYKEKWVEVTGVIQNYRGNPQIRLESPDQVKLIEAPAEPDEKPEPEPTPIAEEMPEPEPEKPKEEPVKTEDVDLGLEVIDGVPAIDWRKYFPE